MMKAKNNLGVLLIHLQEEKRGVMNHVSGNLDDGILFVQNVLRVSRDEGLPIYLSKLDLVGNTDIFPEILEAAGGDAKVIDSPTYDPYFMTPLEDYLKKAKVKRLILAGFHHSACVYQAFIESRRRGIQVVTSPDLLFGHKLNDSWAAEYGQTSKAFETYRRDGTFYKNHRELIKREVRKNKLNPHLN